MMILTMALLAKQLQLEHKNTDNYARVLSVCRYHLCMRVKRCIIHEITHTPNNWHDKSSDVLFRRSYSHSSARGKSKREKCFAIGPDWIASERASASVSDMLLTISGECWGDCTANRVKVSRMCSAQWDICHVHIRSVCCLQWCHARNASKDEPECSHNIPQTNHMQTKTLNTVLFFLSFFITILRVVVYVFLYINLQVYSSH